MEQQEIDKNIVTRMSDAVMGPKRETQREANVNIK